MTIVSELWAVVAAVVEGMIGALVSALSSLTEVFYKTGETDAGFTFVGVLLLMGIGVGLVYFVFNFVRNLVKAG